MKDGESEKTSLLVFADDWGRHPSSAQHLIRRLPPRYAVTWVDTIGMRPPRFDLCTVSRGVEKAGQWLGWSKARTPCVESGDDSIRVCRPVMWPWMRRRWDRWLNRSMLSRQLRAQLSSPLEQTNVVTTVPVVADLVDVLPARRWVYYCVDDFSKWPGLDHRAMLSLERKLVERADRIVAASEVLCEHIRALGGEPYLMTHGVDLQHWSSPAAQPSRAVMECEGPRIVFWGLVDRRLDLNVIRRLSQSLCQGTIVFVGPTNSPPVELFSLPNVRHVSAVKYEELPGVAGAADVLIMPYADNAATRTLQPLKLKEYLATAKPVVARELPANTEWADCLDLAASPQEFCRVVHTRLASGLPIEQIAARRRLSSECWNTKVEVFERVALA